MNIFAFYSCIYSFMYTLQIGCTGRRGTHTFVIDKYILKTKKDNLKSICMDVRWWLACIMELLK